MSCRLTLKLTLKKNHEKKEDTVLELNAGGCLIGTLRSSLADTERSGRSALRWA